MNFEKPASSRSEGRNIEIMLYGQDQLRELGIKVCEFDQGALYHYPCSEEGKAYNMKERRFVDVEEIKTEKEDQPVEGKIGLEPEAVIESELKPKEKKEIEVMLRSQEQLRELGIEVCEMDRNALYSYPCPEPGKAYNMKDRCFVDVREIES